MIPEQELAKLAALYDSFANHLDPLSDDWKSRKTEYLDALTNLHKQFGPTLNFEDFRREVDAPIFISANGGYRSPAHQIGGAKSIHAWGTAANIYRIGDTFLSDAKSIEKYGAVAASLSPAVFVRPFGPKRGETNDHLHIDLGFAILTPRGFSESR